MGAEMAFVVLLGMSGLTGLALYAATGTVFVSALLAIHLACVLCQLFVLLPPPLLENGSWFFQIWLRWCAMNRHG